MLRADVTSPLHFLNYFAPESGRHNGSTADSRAEGEATPCFAQVLDRSTVEIYGKFRMMQYFAI